MRTRKRRRYFLQQWYGLFDPAMEDALYNSESTRRFTGIDRTGDVVLDETTILQFRHLLEKNKPNRYLFEQGLLLVEGAMVNDTIINVPSPTKNQGMTRELAKS